MNDAKFEIEIDELENVLEEELHLYENTSLEYAAEFLESFLKYLKHNRTTGIGGRTPGTLRSNLRDFKDFAFSDGFRNIRWNFKCKERSKKRWKRKQWK